MPARRKAPRRKLQAVVRRRGVPVAAAAAAALARGVGHAVRYRRQYQRVGEALQNAYQTGRTYLGKRKRTGGPSTSTFQDTSAYQQNTQQSCKSGRALSRTAVMNRVVAGAREQVVYQFRKYIVDATGSTNLVSDIGHLLDATNRTFPAFLFDLTGCIQVANAPVVCKRPYCNIGGATDGRIQWNNISGIDPSSALSSVLQRIASPSGVAASSHSKSFLEWVNIKLNCMGATTRPTKVLVQLVQFKDSEMDPWTTDGTLSTTHQAVWQSMMSRLTVNAIHDWKNPDPTAIKVLASKVITFQPIDNQEADVRGHTHTLKWFHRMNKLMDYRQGGTQCVDDANYGTTKEIVNVSGENFNNTADTRNKVFLYITAYCPYSAAAFDRTIHPSFEWNITMKHSLIP